MEYDLLELQEKMREILKPKRYLHSLGVQYTCAALAMRYDCNLMSAQVAGILHDAAKNYDEDEQIRRCEKHQIPITKVEREQPYLLHGKLGAYYAKTKYHVTDEEILSAIAYHTTGKPKMTILEKIVFLSDYIEPSRKLIPGLVEIRKLAFEDLDLAVYTTLHNTLNYLKSNEQTIDNTTYTAYNYYKELVGAQLKD
ncbi:bis(5'-nucleosyl)-tetraphosphatase (symmetrical) YqeK [Anaerosporobacter faecicola]|uniref:bis(5'-nucleosyl)-tetraphosphatase (symmetrical) YqeK n=1 Tax=Anaerosporobacter faecicola TaxID=2718714 RepID=UPI00143933B1|nr:bis(5'-nucleosyl)-tetraphosphatase (symmetrical) YqeK [Anaerosporobacter faecicola]